MGIAALIFGYLFIACFIIFLFLLHKATKEINDIGLTMHWYCRNVLKAEAPADPKVEAEEIEKHHKTIFIDDILDNKEQKQKTSEIIDFLEGTDGIQVGETIKKEIRGELRAVGKVERDNLTEGLISPAAKKEIIL